MNSREELAALEVSHKEEVDKNIYLDREIKKIQKSFNLISIEHNELQEKHNRLSTQNDLLKNCLQSSKSEAENAKLNLQKVEKEKSDLYEEVARLKTAFHQQVSFSSY